MIIYLVGISCVGKSTIGKMLADEIGFSFFDLDLETESFYNMPIEQIQNEWITINKYREKVSIVLDNLFSKNIDCVIAGTPSGLMPSNLEVYKKHKSIRDLYSIFLNDSIENIFNRLVFYDKNSNPIKVKINESSKKIYLKDIEEDYKYFIHSYKQADFQIDINNVKLSEISKLIKCELNIY